MTFKEDCQLLVCDVCSIALTKSFSDHCWRVHNKTVDYESKLVIENYLVPSPYLQPQRIYLDPVDFRPVQPGFRCDSCEYCSSDIKVARKHARIHGLGATYTQCSVQRMNNARQTPYVAVRPREVAAVEIPVNPPAVANAAAVYEKFFRDLRPRLEDDRGIGLFYQLTGFLDPAMLAQFDHVDREEYTRPPKETDADNHHFEALRAQLKNSIKDVSSLDIQFRFSVSPNNKPFSSLKGDSSLREYPAMMVRFIRFLIKLVENRIDFIHLPGQIQAAVHDYTVERTIENLWKLVIAVMQVDPRMTLPSDPFTLFIRFCCTAKAPTYMKACDVERLIAKLLYLCRLAVAYHVSSLPRLEQTVAIRELSELLNSQGCKSISSLTLLKANAHSESKSSAKPPAIMSGSSPFQIQIDGIGVSIASIRNVYKSCMERCQKLQKDLILGGRMPKFQPTDNLSNESTSYGMKAHPDAGEHRRIESSLLQRVLENNGLKQRFVARQQIDSVDFHRAESMEYLKMYDEFIENLFVLIHIGSGMPARATEATTLARINGATSLRGLYLNDRHVFTMACYNKTRSLKGLNTPIARFLDEEVTKIILADNLVVRPFVALLASNLGHNHDETYMNDLFAYKGSTLTAERARVIFADLFLGYSNVPITFGQYRHVAKYFSNLIGIEAKAYPGCDDEDDPRYDQDPDVFEDRSQFGHSLAVADQVYARVIGEHSRIRKHYVENFKMFSKRWHKLLAPGRHVTEARGNHAREPIMHDRDVQDVEHVINLELDLQPLPVRIRRPVDWRTSINSEAFLPINPVKNALGILRRMYNDENASFRSETQRTAADYILNTESNLLVILPTGMGKSTLVFLAAVSDPHSTQLIIVPTVSLRQDLTSRADEFGISVASSLENFVRQRLIILTPEAVESKQVIGHLIQQAHSKRISRVFIDESHMVSTDSDWRKSFLNLPTLGAMDVPLVLLTGTCPPYVAKEISEMFFGPAHFPVIIRQETNRANIEYRFFRCGAFADGMELIISKLRILDLSEDKVIVFVTSQAETINLAEYLNARNWPARSYHAGMSDEERSGNFRCWRNGLVKIIVATSAFGVGIDDPKVRLVVLWGLPYTLLDYLQQSGRAGRDGRPAEALLIFNVMKESHRLELVTEAMQREGLMEMLEFSVLEGICRRRVLSRFVDGMESSCTSIYGCLLCDICDRFLGAGDTSGLPVAHSNLENTIATGQENRILEDSVDGEISTNVPRNNADQVRRVAFGNGDSPIAQNIVLPEATVIRNETGQGIQTDVATNGEAVIEPFPIGNNPNRVTENMVAFNMKRTTTNTPQNHAARGLIFADNVKMIELQALLLRLEGCCGFCLAAFREIKMHPKGFICNLVDRRCCICFRQTSGPDGHFARECPHKHIRLSGNACYSCLLPINQLYHSTDRKDLSNCRKGKHIKEFFRYAAFKGNIINGLQKSEFNPDDFYQAFIEFCRNVRF